MDSLLVINAGSSSVKFQLFGMDGPKVVERLVKGQIDGIGTHPRLRAALAGKQPVDEGLSPERVASVPAALEIAIEWLRNTQSFEPVAVGHRVVHGGPKYGGPVIVDAEVLSDLESYVSLAPLHQPNTLALIHSIWRPVSKTSAGCLLRHGFPPLARPSRQSLRNSATILRSGRSALRFPRAVF